MSMPTQNVQALIEKIQSLPTDRISEVEDLVNFLRERSKQRKTTISSKQLLDFPVDDLGPWPKGISLRREDMYGDDGR
jgi:hypothetical protein